jgi:site-specific DNA recombinase
MAAKSVTPAGLDHAAIAEGIGRLVVGGKTGGSVRVLDSDGRTLAYIKPTRLAVRAAHVRRMPKRLGRPIPEANGKWVNVPVADTAAGPGTDAVRGRQGGGREGGVMSDRSDRIVIVYERVSTDQQDISRQAVQRERASADHPEAEIRVLQDEGVSAFKVSIFDRPGGRALCDLIATGTVDAVYVDAQDRLSRGDDVEWVTFRALCEANGTRLVIDGRELGNDLGGRLEGYLKAVLARQESEEKAHRTRSGLREAARQGRYPGGEPPYGYRAVGAKRERRFLVEPAEAVVVRRIFDEYVAGVGVNRIAARLTAEGIRTRRGANFSARSILAVLPNRTYLGEVCIKGETLATGAHEPIIDPELFARATRLRAAKTSRPNGGAGRPAKRHLLDGLLVCANGHRMLARRWGHSEYYCCSRKHTYGDCDAPDANRRAVDETLLHHFLIRHFDEDEMRERLAAAAGEKIAEARALAAAADREEQEAAAALARIKRDYVAGKISADDWNDFRASLEEEQAASRAKAAQLRGRAHEIEAEAAQVDVEAQLVARLGTLMQAVAGQADSPEAVAELRAALTATFDRVIYRPPWSAAPEGAPVVLGPAELVPVLRADLLGTSDPNSCASARERRYPQATPATPAVSNSAAPVPAPPGRPGRRGPRCGRTGDPSPGRAPRPRRGGRRARRAHA